MIYHEKQLIQRFIENKRAVRWNLWFVESIVLPELVEMTNVRLQVAPVFKDTLREFLEVCIVDIGFGIAELVYIEPATLLDWV